MKNIPPVVPGHDLSRGHFPIEAPQALGNGLSKGLGGEAAPNAAQKIPVLLYHHFLNRDENTQHRDNAFVMDTEVFEGQMRYLYDNNYRTITPNELYGFLFNGKDLPPKSVFIHFDDGYYSNITRAYPILKKFGFMATIFTITSTAIGPQKPFSPETTSIFISQESMKETLDVFTYSSHTHDMHSLGAGTQFTRFILASRQEALDDLAKSLEVANERMTFAYPHGQYNQNRIDILRQAGMAMAFTVGAGYVARGDDPFRLGRLTVYRSTGLDAFKSYVRGEMSFPGNSTVGYTEMKYDETMPPGALTVNLAPVSIVFDGSPMALEAFNKDGNNFFRLRDLAYALNGSKKQFSVDWDGGKNAITLASGKAYSPVGGEMGLSGSGGRIAVPTTSKVFLDGTELSFAAYNINGNNFFRLRDLMSALDIGVTWDGATSTIGIDTSKPYSDTV